MIYSFIKDQGVYQCPSNPNHETIADYAVVNGIPAPGFVSIDISYAMNPRIGEPGGYAQGWGNGGIGMAQINATGVKIVVAESMVNNPDIVWPNTDAPSIYNYMFDGHNSQMNVLFCDGHVKGVKPNGTVGVWTNYAGTQVGSGNMWGGCNANGYLGMTNSVPVGVCGTNNINCDLPETVIQEGMQELEILNQ
jgi:prepilin-type processing-associated H-X9-DG protein